MWCGDHAQFFCACYNVYCLVVVSLFATFALFCFQLLSIVLLEANKNKLLLLTTDDVEKNPCLRNKDQSVPKSTVHIDLYVVNDDIDERI